MACVAHAAVIYSFTTSAAPSSVGAPDYDPAYVTVTSAQGVTGPANGTELAAGAIGLTRFRNNAATEGFFSLISANGTTLGSTSEFQQGYLTWTVTAAPGNTLNLESLTFLSARGGTTGTRGFELYATVNGGAFTYGQQFILNVDAETGVRSSPVLRTADLSAPAFQGIESITFRYYALTDEGTRTIDFKNMTLNGAVVPEPGAMPLALLATLVVACRRSRQGEA